MHDVGQKRRHETEKRGGALREENMITGPKRRCLPVIIVVDEAVHLIQITGRVLKLEPSSMTAADDAACTGAGASANRTAAAVAARSITGLLLCYSIIHSNCAAAAANSIIVMLQHDWCSSGDLATAAVPATVAIVVAAVAGMHSDAAAAVAFLLILSVLHPVVWLMMLL